MTVNEIRLLGSPYFWSDIHAQARRVFTARARREAALLGCALASEEPAERPNYENNTITLCWPLAPAVAE